MQHRWIALLVCATLTSCASVDPNEGIFVLNGVKMPKLTDERLLEIRKAWSDSTPRKAEATRAGRAISWWILDVIAHTESSPPEACSTLELVAIQRRELDLVRGKSGPTEVKYLKPATYHEAWIVMLAAVSIRLYSAARTGV